MDGRKIIGHGTWYDKMAAKIIEREKKLGRSLNLLRTEMGVGASGFPHIGSFADGARAYAVTLALREMGYNSELIAFADDKDGLRKVPAGLPKWLEKYLGYPVTDIPDPYKCHGSFGEHMSSLLCEAFDKAGIEYKFMSGAEVYRRGLLVKEIEKILANAKKVGEIIREEVGQEKYTEVLPYFAVCENCGRIYTTRVYDFLPKENKVLYVCEGMEVKGRWLEGCGYRGEANYAKGEGKLSWKGEFAARWKALDIRFEAYGKDIADSVKVNDRICREILHHEPPLHAKYEMFLDKSGRKISKSAGNVFTPQVWFRYGSPQSLLLLTLKRFVGTRKLDVTDIPLYMDELDRLEDIYFGRIKVEDEMEKAKLKGLYMYCWLMKPPEKPRIHVPYNLLVYLVKVAPKGREYEFVLEKLKQYRYLKGDAEKSEDLKRRIEYALNWVRDFGEEIREAKIKLKENERKAIKRFIEFLGSEDASTAEKIQNAVFQIARENNVHYVELFKTIYMILLGAPRGPRLGPYIIAMGRRNVIEALERALKK
ncbi:MAG TPA: lysine--tRNA ligase [Candidatus Bathyarchaeota archaeon]|nr:lysine--tRNA ligase [Candidatus Bathyarchaeota archaeon]